MKSRILPLFLFPLFFLGCQEDRSNLLPRDKSEELQGYIQRATDIHYGGDCFGALRESEKANSLVEDLRGKIDPALRRNLLDGITRMQILIQDRCAKQEEKNNRE